MLDENNKEVGTKENEFVIKKDKKDSYSHIIGLIDKEAEEFFLTALASSEACKTFIDYELPIVPRRLADAFSKVELEYYAVQSSNPKKTEPFAIIGLYNYSRKNNTAKVLYVNLIQDNEVLAKHAYEIAMDWIKSQRNIRKVTIDLVCAKTIEMFLGDGWQVEGQLKEQIYIADKYHNLTILGKIL